MDVECLQGRPLTSEWSALCRGAGRSKRSDSGIRTDCTLTPTSGNDEPAEEAISAGDGELGRIGIENRALKSHASGTGTGRSER